MTSKRVGTSDLNAVLDRILASEARLASGGNDQLSKAEQAAAAPHIAKAAADIRVSGSTVKTDALSKHLAELGRALTASVNQPSGVGRSIFSKAELKAAKAQDPILGARVEKAYAITSGAIADVDGIAEAHVRGFLSEGIFAQFTSEQLAENYKDPHARSVTWLVKKDDHSFSWGRNDLWAQQFDVDPQTGAITVTGEH
ncbi:MAG: hypothetical protein U1E65_29675 [Myxococcota bacterium]